MNITAFIVMGGKQAVVKMLQRTVKCRRQL